MASVVAVAGGSARCVALLLGSRWAAQLFWAPVAGVIMQDVGLFWVAGAARSPAVVPIALQGLVLLIALARAGAARRGLNTGWL